MSNHEPMAAPAPYIAEDEHEKIASSKTPSIDTIPSESSGENERNEIESLEEYNEGMIEGRKRRNALNNMRAHNALVAGAQWSRKHHGKVIDLSDIKP